jgi:hypothetical protein
MKRAKWLRSGARERAQAEMIEDFGEADQDIVDMMVRFADAEAERAIFSDELGKMWTRAPKKRANGAK